MNKYRVFTVNNLNPHQFEAHSHGSDSEHKILTFHDDKNYTLRSYRWSAIIGFEMLEREPVADPSHPGINCARCGHKAIAAYVPDGRGRNWHINCAAKVLGLIIDPRVEA